MLTRKSLVRLWNRSAGSHNYERVEKYEQNYRGEGTGKMPRVRKLKKPLCFKFSPRVRQWKRGFRVRQFKLSWRGFRRMVDESRAHLADLFARKHLQLLSWSYGKTITLGSTGSNTHGYDLNGFSAIPNYMIYAL
ncbi:hypothetical protein SUGI_1060140 [Cryptomeria japonica]|nr:hypothetical protein SUGI_1060140 [Cryptomeria japonica]